MLTTGAAESISTISKNLRALRSSYETDRARAKAADGKRRDRAEEKMNTTAFAIRMNVRMLEVACVDAGICLARSRDAYPPLYQPIGMGRFTKQDGPGLVPRQYLSAEEEQ